MAVRDANDISFSEVCEELYGDSSTVGRSLAKAHEDAIPEGFKADRDTYGSIKTLMDFRGYQHGELLWRGIDPYCEEAEETHGWRIFATIRSTSSNYGFARFKMVGADSKTKVVITKEKLNSQGGIDYIDVEKPFHSGGGWTSDPEEHDFTFNLSDAYLKDEGASFSMKIYMPKNAYVSEIIASPVSGISGLRNANAGIQAYWYYGLPVQDRLILENQPLSYISFDEDDYMGIVFPSHFSIKDTAPAWDDARVWIDATIYKANQSGKTNGILDIRNSEGRTSESDADWASLQNKGWTLYQ